MEDIHNDYDYKTFLLIMGPPSGSADELQKFYQENKNKSWEDGGHPDYDDKINKIYDLWKETLKGKESIDKQIRLLRNVYKKFLGENYPGWMCKKEKLKAKFRKKQTAEFFHLNYPLLEEGLKQAEERREIENRYLRQDPKTLIILWIMKELYTETPDFSSPFNELVLAEPSSNTAEEIRAFYQEHKKYGGHDYDKDILEIYNLWKLEVKELEKAGESPGKNGVDKLHMHRIFDRVFYGIRDDEKWFLN